MINQKYSLEVEDKHFSLKILIQKQNLENQLLP